MIFCGVKLTHDGAIALIENDKLIFSIEMEKMNNNRRYEEISDTSIIADILERYGYSVDDVDYFIIDGWGGTNPDELAVQPRLKIGAENNILSAVNMGVNYELDIVHYREKLINDSILLTKKFKGLKIKEHSVSYESCLHVTSHVLGAYCTAHFAKNEEDSYVLVWDGGMFPRLYFIHENGVENLGPIFLLIGNIYTIFSQHFGPFKVNGKFAKDDLSIAGKVMAYIAKGVVNEELIKIYQDIYSSGFGRIMGYANDFGNEFKSVVQGEGYKDEDILLSFHVFIERLLIEKLNKKVKRHGFKSRNICFTGGCALNIKWNSAIRSMDIFDDVYVPPFPNDSGSAIGAALVGMYKYNKTKYLKWDVYSGCKLENMPKMNNAWVVKDFSIENLAKLIYKKNEPVVILNESCELGPRALGNRSILGNPFSLDMKKILNIIKEREGYRPVAPICLEEFAKELFIPGSKDPYMIFDHKVNPNWLEKIPAIVHLDNTARLQTVNNSQNPNIHNLLDEYRKISGLPLLCNTSANFNGKGFFPDVKSVMEWGKVNYIWSDFKLYEKTQKINFKDLLKDK